MSLMGYVDEDIEEMLKSVQNAIELLESLGLLREMATMEKTHEFLFQLLMEGRIGT